MEEKKKAEVAFEGPSTITNQLKESQKQKVEKLREALELKREAAKKKEQARS